MPQALPLPVREQIIQLHQQGLSLPQVARALNRKQRSVREIWRRFRVGGEAALKPGYDRCGHPGSRFPAPVVEAALALKRDHPRWGAGFSRIQLTDRFPDTPLPAERTLQNWFQAAGLQPVRAQRPPVRRERAQAVHEVWEIDAKEKMRRADGSGTSTLTVTDEASGALLEVAVFPPVSLAPSAGGGGPAGPAGRLCSLGAAAAMPAG
jgi:hypothetical protein